MACIITVGVLLDFKQRQVHIRKQFQHSWPNSTFRKQLEKVLLENTFQISEKSIPIHNFRVQSTSTFDLSLQGSFGATFKALWHLLPSFPLACQTCFLFQKGDKGCSVWWHVEQNPPHQYNTWCQAGGISDRKSCHLVACCHLAKSNTCMVLIVVTLYSILASPPPLCVCLSEWLKY